MIYNIIYHENITRDIAKMSLKDKKIIQKSIENKLKIDPLLFGRPLRESLSGHRRLRVGDYRIVFRIEDETVKILAIKHRSTVYEKIYSRIF